MNGENSSPIIKHVRAMQIIWFGLLLGIATFAAVTIIIRSEQPKDDLFLSMLMTIVAGTNALLSFIVPGIVAKIALRQNAPQVINLDAELAYPQLAVYYQTSLIVALAMLESGAFCALMGYLLGGVWWTLLVAGVLAFIMLLYFPTVGGVEAWCRTQHETIRMGAL